MTSLFTITLKQTPGDGTNHESENLHLPPPPPEVNPPPEVLDLFAWHLFQYPGPDDYHINKSYPDRTRQTALYNFCLASRAWYQAGIPYLYGCPDFGDEEVLLLASTISPTISGSHAKSNNLAPLITTLDLSWNEHQEFQA